jgi:SAM-dependent methyltransferase
VPCFIWRSHYESYEPPRNHGKAPRMNCDRIARWYRWMEYLGMGRSLERRRSEFLREASRARRVLILGDGDGRFLSCLLASNSSARVDSVDSSSEMIAVSRARLASGGCRNALATGQIEFHHADARTWTPPPDRQYDLVVTHFFLDCFSDEELARLIPHVAAMTTDHASWIVSEFCEPRVGWRAWRAKLWTRGLYLLFGWTTGLAVRRLPDFRLYLRRAGFQRQRQVSANGGMLVSEFWTKG